MQFPRFTDHGLETLDRLFYNTLRTQNLTISTICYADLRCSADRRVYKIIHPTITTHGCQIHVLHRLCYADSMVSADRCLYKIIHPTFSNHGCRLLLMALLSSVYAVANSGRADVWFADWKDSLKGMIMHALKPAKPAKSRSRSRRSAKAGSSPVDLTSDAQGGQN